MLCLVSELPRDKRERRAPFGCCWALGASRSPALAPPAPASSRADAGVASSCQIQSLAPVFTVNPDAVSLVPFQRFHLGVLPRSLRGVAVALPRCGSTGCQRGSQSRVPRSSLCPSAPLETHRLDPPLRSGSFLCLWHSLGHGVPVRKSNIKELDASLGSS